MAKWKTLFPSASMYLQRSGDGGFRMLDWAEMHLRSAMRSNAAKSKQARAPRQLSVSNGSVDRRLAKGQVHGCAIATYRMKFVLHTVTRDWTNLHQTLCAPALSAPHTLK